jgi:acyl-CoA reductase-like NAD-dependent aldehyde dehydrogenase
MLIKITAAVHINSITIHDEPVLPHGGVKNSGWGRLNGNMGLKEFLVTKTVTWKNYWRSEPTVCFCEVVSKPKL